MTTTSRPVVVVQAIIRRDNLVLLCKRPSGSHFAGSWEFPGGKVEYGESPEEALHREILEELEVDVSVGTLVDVSSIVFPEKHIIIIAFNCEIVSGEIYLREHEEMKWVALDKINLLELTPGSAKAASVLLSAPK